MDSGTVIVGAPDQFSTGPTQYLAIVGNPSPASPDDKQLVTPTNGGWFDFLKESIKAPVQAVIGTGSATEAVGKASLAIGEGAQKAGAGIQAAATSASSGIKWGIAILIVGAVLFILAPYINLIPRRN